VLLIASIAIFFAVGAAAGFYFRVFILVAPILAALALAVGLVLDGYRFGFAGIVFLCAAISCQAGYLAGSLMMTLIFPVRAHTTANNSRTIGSRALRRRQNLSCPQLAPRQPRLPHHRRHPTG
jgi:hypothetical protein